MEILHFYYSRQTILDIQYSALRNCFPKLYGWYSVISYALFHANEQNVKLKLRNRINSQELAGQKNNSHEVTQLLRELHDEKCILKIWFWIRVGSRSMQSYIAVMFIHSTDL